MAIRERNISFKCVYAALTGLLLMGIILYFDWKAALLLPALMLTFLIFRNPKIGLAMTIIAVLNLQNLGKLEVGEALLFPSIAKILGLITLTAWLFQVLKNKKKPVFTGQMVMGSVFMLLSLLSAVYALESKTALITFTALFTCYLLYFLIPNLIDTPDSLEKFVLLLVVTALIASSVAVMQRYLPALHLDPETSIQEFGMHEGAVVNPEFLKSGNFTRPTGTMGHHNWLSLFMLTILALNVYFMSFGRTYAVKLLGLISLITGVIALVFTHDKLGFLGMAFVVILMLWKRLVGLNAPKIVALCLSLILFYVFIPATYKERVFSVAHIKTSESTTQRWELHTVGWDIFTDNFVKGVGLGNFGAAFMTKSSHIADNVDYLISSGSNYKVLWLGAHNMYLEIACETGIVGLLALLAFLALGMRDLKKAEKDLAENNCTLNRYMARALYVCILGFAFTAIFLHAQDQKPWWIVMGLSAAIARIASNMKTEKQIS